MLLNVSPQMEHLKLPDTVITFRSQWVRVARVDPAGVEPAYLRF